MRLDCWIVWNIGDQLIRLNQRMSSIESFVESLKLQQNTSTVSNPYLSDDLAANLQCYLEAMMSVAGKRVLLVGEAPGFKGCKLTGIPFSSGKMIEESDHRLFRSIKKELTISEIDSENTATMVWEYLARKRTIPLFWNSFPFHPHPENNLHKNRAPNKNEIATGVSYLQNLAEIFQPERIAGIGHAGTRCATLAFPDREIAYIRHPSYGGKSDFVKGMNKLL